MRRLSIPLAGLLILAGCATHVDTIDVEAEAMANPEVALSRSLDRVALASTAMQATLSGAGRVAPAELHRPITWRWTGPLDEAAKALATKIGYSYAPPGPDGPAMPTVSINASGATALDVFRTMGTQAGSRATLSVDPDRRIVQVLRHV